MALQSKSEQVRGEPTAGQLAPVFIAQAAVWDGQESYSPLHEQRLHIQTFSKQKVWHWSSFFINDRNSLGHKELFRELRCFKHLTSPVLVSTAVAPSTHSGITESKACAEQDEHVRLKMAWNMLERSKVPPSELLLSPGTQVFKPLEVPFHIRSHDSDSNADSLVTCHFTTFDKLKLIKRVAKVSIRLVWDHKACTTGYRCDLTKGWTYRGQATAWASHGSNGCMIGKENFRTWSQHTHSHCCVSSKPRAMHHSRLWRKHPARQPPSHMCNTKSSHFQSTRATGLSNETAAQHRAQTLEFVLLHDVCIRKSLENSKASCNHW